MSTSSIANLTDDTLLSIFDTITSEMPFRYVPRMDRPLTVIRLASQVCRRWRTLVLASPWIWGRLIDLQGFYGEQLEWSEEVVRRSKSAPLWIYGDVYDAPSDYLTFNTERYFVQILESWERVEKLSVIIYSADKKVLDYLHIRFLSGAPILKLFDLRFPRIQGSLFLETLLPGSSKRLFADYAPSLQAIRANQVAYRSYSPWLSNIREICPFSDHFTLDDIFLILQRTPIIERIGIHSRDLPWIQPPFPKLSLPNLSSIFLVTNISVVAGILNHITPGILSAFYMNTQDSHSESLSQPYILSSLNKNLPSYMSNYLTSKSPTILLLGISDRILRFCDVTHAEHDEDPQPFELFIGITFTDRHDWDNLVSCLLDALTTSFLRQGNGSLESITELRMRCMEVQPFLLPKLRSMLALLRHVRDIHTDEQLGPVFWALACLDEASDDPQHILFPQLHTLHFINPTSPRYIDIITDSAWTEFTLFLAKRKSIGFPVAKLDFTSCRKFKPKQDLCDLEGVEGLEIVWEKRGNEPEGSQERCSYICGTGNPELLRGIV